MSGRAYSQELFDAVLKSKPPKFMPAIHDNFDSEIIPLKGWVKFKFKWFLGWRYFGCVGLWKFFTNGKKNKFKFPILRNPPPTLCPQELISAQPMTHIAKKHRGLFHIKYIYPPFKRGWSCITGLRFKT